MLVHFPSLLVIDDDRHILRSLQMNLEQDGFEVRVADNGTKALELFKQKIPDLAIVDLLLPDMHGFEVSRRMKAVMDIPILMLTAVDSEEIAVEGIQKYAEDYVLKPYRYQELKARIDRIIERNKHLVAPDYLEIIPGEMRLELVRQVIIMGNKEVALTPMESRLLACLARNANSEVSSEVLMDQVWPDGEGDILRLKVAIHRLRAKMDANSENRRCIFSVRGKGYVLATE